MYSVMPQCENIILGASHDNGYARILSKLETTNIMPGKVILLQGPSLAPELERFDTFLFPRVRFRELFMEKLAESGKRYAQAAAEGNLSVSHKSTSPRQTVATPSKKLVEPDLGKVLMKQRLNCRCVAFCEKSFSESL